MLYQFGLVYAIDLWKLQHLQLQCIKRVLGTKAHSSSSAVEVISGVIPFGICKRELCCREYIRIISEAHNHPLMQLFNDTTRVGLKFCPMEYIRIMSRQLQRQLQGCVFQSVHGSYAFQAKISQSIMRADICELDNTDMANCVKKEKEIVIFTDGSVFGGPVGCGACAAAFPEVNDKDGF